MKDWKGRERKVAGLLGGKRVPLSGRGYDDAPDIEHERLSIAVKSRRRLPQWLEDAVQQAEASAVDRQLPVAVLRQDGRRYTDRLVVLRLRDFARILACSGKRNEGD